MGDLAVVWSWKIRVGGKRDGGGRGIWEETLICSASICYLSAEFGLGITHIFAHIARPAEVGPLLVLPSRVIIARWILISYCMEERQEYPVRDLSAVRAIFRAGRPTDPVEDEIQYEVLVVLHERRRIIRDIHVLRCTSQDLPHPTQPRIPHP